jgi:hypothetical protein
MAQRYRYDHGKSVLQATLPKYASTWGMNDVKVTNVDRTAEDVLVTFADGNTFLFLSDFLYRVLLKEGQLAGPPEKSVG